MTIEHSLLTYLKDKGWVAGGTLERMALQHKPATINRTLRRMAEEKKLETDFTRLPKRAVSYRHNCEGKCGDVMDNVTKEIYHKCYNN